MIGYGYTRERVRKIGPITASPLADTLTVRYRAQSMRSRGGTVAELPSYADAVRIIADASRERHVTVPEPLREPAARTSGPAGDTPHAAPDRVQASGAYPQPPPNDDDAACDDYMRRAFAGEFIPF